MLRSFEHLLRRARQRRSVHLLVVNLRILLGFAFVPAGLKKVIGEPFTAPDNSGPFHDFLHAFFATGSFYYFVGIVQLTAATLLFTQRFATLGALLSLPVLTAILVFCWSTAVYPTATVVTLMFAGTVALLLWDFGKWRGLVSSTPGPAEHEADAPPPVDLALWRRCGLSIFALYLGVCAATGEVYRPKGLDLGAPAFYMFPVIMLMPVVTFAIDQARHRAWRARDRQRSRRISGP